MYLSHAYTKRWTCSGGRAEGFSVWSCFHRCKCGAPQPKLLLSLWGKRKSLLCVCCGSPDHHRPTHLTSNLTDAPPRQQTPCLYCSRQRFLLMKHLPYPVKVRQHVLTESQTRSNPRLLSKAEQKKEGHFHSSLSTSPFALTAIFIKNYLQIMSFLCSRGVFPFLSVVIKIVQTERQLYSRQTVWVHDRNSMLHAHIHPFPVFVGISC